MLFLLYKGKGGTESPDNIEGVVCLDVVSTLVSKLLNDRLIAVVEQVVDESEPGYRRGCGIGDAVFVAGWIQGNMCCD